MTAGAPLEIPYAFACEQCYGSVPLVTIAEGVRIACSECGHRHTVTREWLEELCAGRGARPRALLEGLAPVGLGEEPSPAGGLTGDGARAPISERMALGNAGSSSMHSRRAAMEQQRSENEHAERAPAAQSLTYDALDSLSDSFDSTEDAPREREAAEATSEGASTLGEPSSPFAFAGAGVPSSDSLDTATARTSSPPANPALSKTSERYRGPHAPAAVSLSGRTMPAPPVGEFERIEAAGRRLAIVSAAPYAASVTLVLLLLLLALGTLPALRGILDGVLTLPAFTLLALFAGGLLFVAGTVRGTWRGVLMTGIGLLPMLFVVPALFQADGLVMVLLLLMPLFIAVCYGSCAAAAVYANGTAIKVVAAFSGFTVLGMQVSISLGERGVLQLPGTGEGSPILFVLALFMGIGPLLAIYNLLNPDETRARWAVAAHWIGYLGIPALLIFVLSSFQLLLTLELLIVVLFMFGWVFAAGAGIRELLLYFELKHRGHFAQPTELAPGPLRPSAVVGSSAGDPHADTARFGAIPPARSLTQTAEQEEEDSGGSTGFPDVAEERSDSWGPAPLPPIPDDGRKLFGSESDASASGETNLFGPSS